MPISITINERKLSAEPGMTVLDVARANDIYIPTLCYAPKLAPFGGCRLCVVEVERMGGLPTACTLPASDGMIVRTDTPAVQTQRRETFSLLLSEHPYTCITCKNASGCIEFQGTIRKAAVTTGCQYCPKSGQCELQQVAEHICLSEVPYSISYRGLPVEHGDPFFDRDMNLCIVCNRCVRTCSDIRHANVLALVERGNHTIVGTVAGRSLLDAGCQFCGACVDACPTGALFDKKSKWEGVPATIVPSVCPYCSVGCAVHVQARSGRVLRAVGNDKGLTNDGEVCVRGRFAMVDIVHNLLRLKTPLVRRGTRLIHASWEAALDAAAQGLAPYKGDQFAAIGSPTATNEESYLLQKLSREVMQSNNVAMVTARFDSDLAGLLKAGSAPIANIRKAASILVIGSSVVDSHPIIALEIKHALTQCARLLVVDPRQTKLARQADLWLRPRIGADHVLLAGMMKAMVKDPANEAGVDLPRLSLERAAGLTGVGIADLRAAADLLVASRPVMIIYGSGITHQPQATNAIKAIGNLAALTGADVIGLPGEGNIVGAYDMGVHPALLPGYRAAGDRGRDYQGIVQGLAAGDIKSVYLAGDVPPLPELAKAAFLVVQGIANTDVLRYAHVVLPATTFAEMDGTMTNLEGRVQRVRQVVDPIGQARPGWQIIQEVATRLGADWGAAAWEDVLAEVASVIPAYSALSAHTLGVAGLVRQFAPPAAPPLASFSLDGLQPIATDEFPLTLITDRNTLYYRGLSLTKEVKGLDELRKENVVHVSAQDAGKLGMTGESHVKLVTRFGSAYLTARADDALPPGLAFLSVNPVMGSPAFAGMAANAKTYAVRIELGD